MRNRSRTTDRPKRRGRVPALFVVPIAERLAEPADHLVANRMGSGDLAERDLARLGSGEQRTQQYRARMCRTETLVVVVIQRMGGGAVQESGASGGQRHIGDDRP